MFSHSKLSFLHILLLISILSHDQSMCKTTIPLSQTKTIQTHLIHLITPSIFEAIPIYLCTFTPLSLESDIHPLTNCKILLISHKFSYPYSHPLIIILSNRLNILFRHISFSSTISPILIL